MLDLNASLSSTELSPFSVNRTELTRPLQEVILDVSFIVGIFGNLAALYILQKEKSRYKNKKHALLLRCMSGNDLVALVGMLILTHVPKTSQVRCMWIVIWRVFGMSSGCVALVMAFERWLALTHPFLYQKRVTYNVLLKCILVSWSVALVVTSMPLLGFGLYFDPKIPFSCKKHREATEPIDIAYTFVYFVFGLLLCLGISTANLAVTRFLCQAPDDECVGRRFSRYHCKSMSKQPLRVESMNTATPDEIAFARLMVALSITFLICWLPLLLTIPLEQVFRSEVLRRKMFPIANILLLIHFNLDPFIYVLLHHYFPCLRFTFDAVQRYCCCGKRRQKPPLEGQSCSV